MQSLKKELQQNPGNVYVFSAGLKHETGLLFFFLMGRRGKLNLALILETGRPLCFYEFVLNLARDH